MTAERTQIQLAITSGLLLIQQAQLQQDNGTSVYCDLNTVYAINGPTRRRRCLYRAVQTLNNKYCSGHKDLIPTSMPRVALRVEISSQRPIAPVRPNNGKLKRGA